MSEKKKFGQWIKDGLKANFTGDNIRKINAAFATLIINILASVGLLVIAASMEFINPLITVVVVSIWASFEGFLSVAVIAMLGSPGAEAVDGVITKKFKAAVEDVSEESLLDLSESIKERIEETFNPDAEPVEEVTLEELEEELADAEEPEPELVVEPEVIE